MATRHINEVTSIDICYRENIFGFGSVETQSGEESSSSGCFNPVGCLHQSQLTSVRMMKTTHRVETSR